MSVLLNADVFSWMLSVSAVKEEPCSRPAVHECLGEVLRVLRQVISTYPLLNTVETLTAAGTLISKVKGQYNCNVFFTFIKPLTIEKN